MRSFLKWPGGKSRLCERIKKSLPQGDRLVEPFVGSGAVFLNTDYKRYWLGDINPDLINLYKILQKKGQGFIEHCKDFFKPRFNRDVKYYQLRKKFNAIKTLEEKAALFLYLNRHGYNGLCRYSLRKKEYNVPFGYYKKPYFPEEEMFFFHEKAKKAQFVCMDFREMMEKTKNNDVVYCDPPYAPLSKTASFSAYQPNKFDLTDQESLAHVSEEVSKKGVCVVISNHATVFTKKLYHRASIEYFYAHRFISCKGHLRKPVKELLAVYSSDT